MSRRRNTQGVHREVANQNAIVRALLDAGHGVQSLSAVGCGCPDLLVWSPPRREYLLIEVKNPEGDGKLTDAQRAFHRAWPGPIALVMTPSAALFACAPNGRA